MNSSKDLISTKLHTEENLKRKHVKENKQWVNIMVKKRSITEETIDKDFHQMMEYSTKFASYLKTKEMAKKDRRAIASPQMFLRMFLYAIEHFHLNLSKFIEGSTIAIGGNEKKAKITSTLNSATLPFTTSPSTAQETEDATKWNECQSPEMFSLMHDAILDETTLKKSGIPFNLNH